MVLRERIELSTSPLPRECSTTELPQLSPERLFDIPERGRMSHRPAFEARGGLEARRPPGYRCNGLAGTPRRRYKNRLARCGRKSGPAARRSVAQPGSAPRSGRGGRRFESSHSDHCSFAKEAYSYDATTPQSGVAGSARHRGRIGLRSALCQATKQRVARASVRRLNRYVNAAMKSSWWFWLIASWCVRINRRLSRDMIL